MELGEKLKIGKKKKKQGKEKEKEDQEMKGVTEKKKK
eukprot:CAMPEP_0170556874 /NCGR_PEP_ID=MMETSP0211-20121228/19022_1 /TAXON_ID=311385 /ORGANISM="Pseudokeronopsis sp., Strain OXSARD2" /LENGTH=36 /DNA_ID= /DNA_START= /DNA_END= /DNA_ORIENTATION=